MVERRLSVLIATLLIGSVGLALWAERPPADEQSPLPDLSGRHAAASNAPSVVLVIGCTFRADQTSAYGEVEGDTPFLEDLAARGVRFADTIAQGAWTRPGSTAILTGQYPNAVALTDPGPGRNPNTLLPAVTTLAEFLQAAGYATIGATANPNLNASYGFDQGYDVYHEGSPLWQEEMRKVPGELMVERLLGSVDQVPPGRPFFLQAMLVDAHLPAGPDEDRRERFTRDAPSRRVGTYRAMLADLDDVVRDLYSGLEARGHGTSDTLFVVVGDHGEGLMYPAHHGNGHGNYLYPSVAHVPWVMAGPGVAPGHVVRGLSAQIDVVPTLLSTLGVGGYEGPGASWARQVAGESDRTNRDSAYIETFYQWADRAALYTDRTVCFHDFEPELSQSKEASAAKQFAKRKKQGALFANRLPAFREGCFDRTADPMAEGEPFEDRAMLDELLAQRAANDAARAAIGGPIAGQVDESVLRQLEALGYVDGD